MNHQIKEALSWWFQESGVTVLVDGQYGSTGKGLIAGALAECFWQRVNIVICNAGPNAGHTSYFGDEKIVLKQLPTFSVTAHKILGDKDLITTYLCAGAIIDIEILERECREHDMRNVLVHPAAALLDKTMKEQDVINLRAIASTGQGVGPALQRKLQRTPGAVYGSSLRGPALPLALSLDCRNAICFFEVPQGFSLGINSGFYPHVTARECTVSQALADAGMPPSFHRKTIMSVRTYPIRVGNTEGSSGPCYFDQEELTWKQLGVEPEMTTVTGRVRRVFTWSAMQFEAALLANAPDVIFLNFVNYLKPGDVQPFIVNNIMRPYKRIMGRQPEAILLGFGPRSQNIFVQSKQIGKI